MRLKARTDTGHAAIVHALRQAGCQVLDLSRVGSGCPDLLVWAPAVSMRFVRLSGESWLDYGGGPRLLLMEVKAPRGKLTADQKRFHAVWPETVIVRSLAEALQAVGVQT